jgi:hypothetical protein
MFAVRSHARRYAGLQRQQREKPLQRRLKDRQQRIQIAPKPLTTGLDPDRYSLDFDEGIDVSAEPSKEAYAGQYPFRRQPMSGKHSHPARCPNSPKNQSKTQTQQVDDEVRLRSRPRITFESQPQRPLSPQTILGAGRLDPFQSFPIKTSCYMQKLVDYCKRILTVIFQQI